MNPCRTNSGFLVRPFRSRDTESFYNAVRNSIDALCYWMPWCTPDYSPEQAERWISFCESAWSGQAEYPLGIFDEATEQVIGGTGINHINLAYHIGNIGYWVATPHCGRGAATAAARMAIDIGFRELGFTRLEIVVLLDNAASHAVARKVGASRECDAQNRLYFKGLPATATLYSIVPGATGEGQGRVG